MVHPPSIGPLAAVGINEPSEQVYRLSLRRPGSTIEQLCDELGRSLADFNRDIQPLIDRHLVSISGDQVFPEPPEFALGRLLTTERRRLTDAEDALAEAQDEVTTYVAEHLVGQRSEWQPVPIDVIPAAELGDVMLTLIGNSAGELLFLRPDQWFLPTGVRMDMAVTQAIGAGRSSRVIYPARIIETNHDSVQARARAGERIRVLPEVPTRMAVFGSTAAVLPEIWGSPAGYRMLIRQSAIVSACVAYFDQLWSHAVTVPGFGAEVDAGSRGQLLELLARGAKDEQIARTLDMSLRTVRRRVADLIAELGVDTRFQAGMEAVRRGWL